MSQTSTAKLRHLRIAPRKTRFVADVIRGMSLNEAEAQLLLSPRRPSVVLLKLLRSAAANAKLHLKVGSDVLFIKEIRVDEGPKLKRWMPRARGAAAQIQKKTSHITITLGVSTTAKKAKYTFRETPKKKGKAVKKTKHEHDKTEGSKEENKEGAIDEMPKKSARANERDASRDKRSSGRGFMKKIFQRKVV